MALKYLTLLATVLAFMACGSNDDENGSNGSDTNETETVVPDCPQSSIQAALNAEEELVTFDFVDAFAIGNESWGTYRAIFINYPKAKYEDGKKPLGSTNRHVIISMYRKDQGTPEPGLYKTSMNNPDQMNIMTVQIETSESRGGMSASGGHDPGQVELIAINKDMMCGTVDVHDSQGMRVKGNFNVNFD